MSAGAHRQPIAGVARPSGRRLLRLLRLAGILGGAAVLGGGLWLGERLGRPAELAVRTRLARRVLEGLGRALPYDLQRTGRLPQQPMLWVCNHVSWCDIPLRGGLAPLCFLAKSEVRGWPLAGWLAERAGTQFIRRGQGESGAVAGRLARLLAEGHSLLVFPEGTTGDGRALLPFHARLLESAIAAGVPVQPVALRYRRNGARDRLAPFLGNDSLPAHLLRLLGTSRADVSIELLAPIPSQGRTRRALAQAARDAIESALGERPAGDAPGGARPVRQASAA